MPLPLSLLLRKSRRSIVLVTCLLLGISFIPVQAADCGDADASGQINIADVVYLVNYIFASGPAPLDEAAGDFNCNNETNIADAVFMVSYIFASGPAPCGGPGCAVGILLTGDPDSMAVSAVIKYGPIAADSAATDSSGLLKTRLEAVLNPAATVGEVNAALNFIGGKISWMIPEGLSVTIAVPVVQSKQEADSLGALLVASGAFLLADAAFQVDLSGTVEMTELPPTGTNEIYHLRQMRMPAAWNLGKLAQEVNADVTVFVPDGYYRTTPHPEIPAQTFVIGDGRPELVSTVDGNHGFCTSGIIGARHDDKNTTGVHSDPASRLAIRSMLIGGLTMPEIISEIVDNMPSGRFVLSTSFGFSKDISEFSKAKRAIQAMDWRRQARPRKDDFIHIASAGNEGMRTDDSRYAALSSAFNVAAAFDSPFDLYAPGEIGPLDLAALTAYWAYTLSVSPFNSLKMDNVLVVGASDVSGNESSFSNSGSLVRAQGEDVAAPCLRVDPAEVDGGCFATTDGLHISYYDGTSFSTPQVAGLAAYLLSLDPLLSNSEIKDIIYNSFANSANPGFVDAYLAVQSLDNPFNNWDIRRTLLDVADGGGLPGTNGQFDRADIVLFLAKFAEYEQLRAGVPDAPADYSRYDLNGDGFTGGTTYATKFDLDVNQPQSFGAVSIAAGGQTLQLDENSLVDLDVLCYYARTSLYTGPPSALDTLMVDCPCSQVSSPNRSCQQGRVVLTRRSGSSEASIAGFPNIRDYKVTSTNCELQPCEYDLDLTASVSKNCGAFTMSATTSHSSTVVVDSILGLQSIVCGQSSDVNNPGGLSCAGFGSVALSVLNARFLVLDAPVDFEVSATAIGTTSGDSYTFTLNGPGFAWLKTSGTNNWPGTLSGTLQPGEYSIQSVCGVNFQSAATPRPGPSANMDFTFTFFPTPAAASKPRVAAGHAESNGPQDQDSKEK